MYSATFLKLGNRITKSSSGKSKKTALIRFKSFFGVTPQVCSIVWEQIKDEVPPDSDPKHLLWSLLFLKKCEKEHIRQSLLKMDAKTIRKWTWIYVELLSQLNMIIWDKRFESAVENQACYCSLDGVDFKISEPKPLDGRWYSHKFRGAAIRYEIGLNIQTGNIVWTNGGYPCGVYPNLQLARDKYVLSVNDGELTMAKKIYPDKRFFILPNKDNKIEHKRIMSRHDVINRRMKLFKILKQKFSYNLEKHPMVFKAVANLVQLLLQNGEPLNTHPTKEEFELESEDEGISTPELVMDTSTQHNAKSGTISSPPSFSCDSLTRKRSVSSEDPLFIQQETKIKSEVEDTSVSQSAMDGDSLSKNFDEDISVDDKTWFAGRI